MDEIIYIVTNEAMPGYVKIGRTTNLEDRIRSLDTTSVPLPFECFFACTVKDAAFVEHQLHDAFLDHRVRSSREFFEISPERVVAALRLAAVDNLTPRKDFVASQEDQQALNHARRKREVFNFKMVNIPVGAEIVFSRDKNITAKVIDNRNIEFKGEQTSLSSSAQKILNYDYPVAGTEYWMYEGETLDERRRRIESEG
ncbi:MAG: GIY-YIG nuclease family protein [Ignavibacteriae bacterium]|nr:GIY-YIG nuclease family protein [Ignavibacteria bacterium]MBI3363656.1 GIY-YIG nuclease family protein [Ignavibacteriota bacterium]